MPCIDGYSAKLAERHEKSLPKPKVAGSTPAGTARLTIAAPRPRVIDQIKKLSPGTVAYMSLGTNDAVGSVKGLEKSIDAVIAAAERARVKLVWLGPPCVNKAWDKNARVAAVATLPHPAGSALVPRRRPLAG